MSKSKIYAFSNTESGGDGPAVALAEDGTVLASHWCSNEGWVAHDLGATSDWKHEHYTKHYPNGFEVEFIPAAERDGHHGLQAALEKNEAQAKPADAA